MDSPVHNSIAGVGAGDWVAKILGPLPVVEWVLASFLVGIGAAWYAYGDVDGGGLSALLASAGTAIFLLICFVLKTRRRLTSNAAKSALLSGQIKHSGELYRAVVDTAADAIVLADQRGTVLSFNRAAEIIFGYSELDVVGRNVKVLMPQDQWKTQQEYLTRYQDIEGPHIVGVGRVVEGLRKDGTLFPLHLSIAEWSNGPGEVGFTAIMRDITAQQQVQQALIESESQIRLIMDCAMDYAIYQIDLDDRIVKWNKGTELILGYSAAELKGFDINRLFPHGLSVDEDAGQTTGGPTDLGRRETEGWRLRRDGTRFWASGVVQPIFDSAGNVMGKAVVLRDETTQRTDAETLQLAKDSAEAAAQVESELRAEIEASNLELVAANQGLQQFTSIVAHDLRAPLKRIDAFIGALREDYNDRLDDEGKEIMTRVSRGAARMELMLDSLLDYSRYNAKAITGKSADLAHVIKGVIETFDFKKFESKIDINAENAPRIKGDPLLLAHVFQNLIGNSIKFRRSEQPLSIDIDVKQAGDAVQIVVTDNGIGIEPQFADQVFDMFYRLHDEDEYDGTGIGLTVCRKIVGDHGGRIWVDKEYSAGTRINMTLLPASDERTAEPDLVMMLYQSMQRRRGGKLERGMEGMAARMPRIAAAKHSHHAKFNRHAR